MIVETIGTIAIVDCRRRGLRQINGRGTPTHVGARMRAAAIQADALTAGLPPDMDLPMPSMGKAAGVLV